MIVKYLAPSDTQLIKKVIYEIDLCAKNKYNGYSWEKMSNAWIEDLKSAILEREEIK